MRKTLLIAATVLAAGAGLALIGQAQAAPAAKDPLCGIGAMSGATSWQEYYHCWGTPPKEAAARPAKGPAKDPMCGIGAMSSSLSWQERYNCYGAVPAIKVSASKPPANPYCGMGAMAGSQSWAAYYHCW